MTIIDSTWNVSGSDSVWFSKARCNTTRAHVLIAQVPRVATVVIRAGGSGETGVEAGILVAGNRTIHRVHVVGVA